MDELVDILSENGEPTGTTAMKSEAHRKGLFHATVHVWFYTDHKEILIQQRGKNKDTYPLLWDVSVAGHVSAGESIETSALREISEEIGLDDLPAHQLEKIGTFKSLQKHSETLIDAEFHHTYICLLQAPLSKLTKQESEVEKLALIPFEQFKEELLRADFSQKYVPHDLDYYRTVLASIDQRL
ncbi:NUDIX hydrolase [Maribacter thermophilus]|uniref:NUDIX hydrolase n=1 Tax=Maribacter thermophilus TaxID=1197874 RepID=UPI000640F217|nr:NUDIX domain-containing protein [Maribacter thermophilus]